MVNQRGKLHVSPESEIRIAVDCSEHEDEKEDRTQSAVCSTHAEISIPPFCYARADKCSIHLAAL